MLDEFHGRPWEPGTDISPKQTAAATALRIPILSTVNPRWSYITGIVVSDDVVDHGIMPTDEEVAAVATHLAEYRNHWLNRTFQQAMTRLAPYDIDSGANLGYYLKRPDGRWGYRKKTWTQGACWWSYGDGSLSLCIAHNQGRAELVGGTWRTRTVYPESHRSSERK